MNGETPLYFKKTFKSLIEETIHGSKNAKTVKIIGEHSNPRPPTNEAKAWDDLEAAEKILKTSKQSLTQSHAGADLADCSRTLEFIEILIKKCSALDVAYGNFDEGSNDYKTYHDRYCKFKDQAQNYRDNLYRRKDKQEKLISFISDCEERSGVIGPLINQLTSNDWCDEKKDVIEAKLELQKLTQLINAENTKIERVLERENFFFEVEMGNELRQVLFSKTNQLRDDKYLAVTLLEAVQIQIDLLEEYQNFYKECNQVKIDLENSRRKTNSLVTDMNGSNVQNRFDQLQEIKITFTSINTKINAIEGRAKTVSNIKARGNLTEKHITAVSFKSGTVNVYRNEQLTLTACKHRWAWEWHTESGHDITLPAAIVVSPLPNKDAIGVANSLEQSYCKLEDDYERIKANCDFFNASNKFAKTAGLILEWDEFTLPPIQTRSSSISNIEESYAEAGRFVDASQNRIVSDDYGKMAAKIDECHAHIEALATRLRQQKMTERYQFPKEQLGHGFQLKLDDA